MDNANVCKECQCELIIVCKHCGKTVQSDAEYCSNCAEPVACESKVELSKSKHITREERVKRSYKSVTVVVAILLFVFAFPLCMALGWLLYPGTLGNDLFYDKADTFATIAWLSSIAVWVILRYIYWQITKKAKMKKRVKKQTITDQFREDATSICPFCGSHDIKIYREGYNYNKGFWLSTFGVKGGGYVAGMNSNRARCRCMSCGNDWATNYDYRLINKQ